jgi:hypothetical protein
VALATLTFAVLAFGASLVGIWFAWRQNRDGERERYAGIAVDVSAFFHAAQYGWPTGAERALARLRLQAKLVGIDDLPAARKLAYAEISPDPSDDALALAEGAAEEVRIRLREFD